MENKNIRIITIACFAILAAWDIFDLIDYFNFLMLISVIGSILVVIALLIKNTVLSTVGFGLLVFSGIISILQNIGPLLGEGWIPVFVVFLWILSLTRDIFLLLVSIKPKSAKTLGTIAAGFAAVRLVAIIINNLIEGYEFSFEAIAWGVLITVSAMLLGLTYDGYANSVSVSKTHVPVRENAVAQNTLQTNNVEKILRLKEFLDQGVITQEEFDQKKKELLNL